MKVQRDVVCTNYKNYKSFFLLNTYLNLNSLNNSVLDEFEMNFKNGLLTASFLSDALWEKNSFPISSAVGATKMVSQIRIHLLLLRNKPKRFWIWWNILSEGKHLWREKPCVSRAGPPCLWG